MHIGDCAGVHHGESLLCKCINNSERLSIKHHSRVQNVIGVDSKKGRCTLAYGIRQEDDMRERQKQMLRGLKNKVGGRK